MTQSNLQITTAGRNARRHDGDTSNPIKTVSIPLGTLVPVLLEAAINNSAWLSDFAEESVRIDEDLYEVLLAYGHLRRSAA